MKPQPQKELVLKPKKVKLSGKIKKKVRNIAEKSIISGISLKLMNNSRYTNKEFLKTLIIAKQVNNLDIILVLLYMSICLCNNEHCREWKKICDCSLSNDNAYDKRRGCQESYGKGS